MPCIIHPASYCHAHPYGLTRRQALRGLGGAGLAAAGATGLGFSPGALALLFAGDELIGRTTALFEQAGGAALGELMAFTITPGDLPWEQQLMAVSAGQSVTFLLGGRWHVAREHDIWFEPGLVFHARVAGGPMFNPSSNTGTLVAGSDGRIEIARAGAEWANADGELWTPLEDYRAGDGEIQGVAIAWKGDPEAGLQALLAHGDVGGLISTELRRLQAPPQTPPGWKNHYSFGEGGIFSLCGPAEMCCQTGNNVAILQRDVSHKLQPGLQLGWRWLISELPSQVPENSVATHDYMSIGVEFDDGQDITYFWSAGLPVGEAFRCPLPGWNKIETHVVQRSGLDGLGRWFPESRDIERDYRELIGGDAGNVVRVWLLGVSVFQRRAGYCRYTDIVLNGPGGSETLI